MGMRRIAVAVATVLLLGGEVVAWQATVSVERIEAGDVDAPGAIDEAYLAEPDLEEGAGVVRVCVNSGRFIFAVQRYPLSAAALGVIFRDDEAIANVNVLRIAEQGEWGWDSFAVHEPTCVQATVVGGRARLYRLRFAVNW